MNDIIPKRNVEDLLKTHLKNIYVVNELNQLLDNQCFKTIHINDISGYNIERLYEDFYEVKKKLQLILNLYNGHELYKDCVVQRDQIGDNDNNENQDLIIKMAYKYIRYLIAISNMELRIINDAPIECKMCNTEIKPNEIQCSVCLEMAPNNKRKQVNVSEIFNIKRTKTDDEIKSKNTKYDTKPREIAKDGVVNFGNIDSKVDHVDVTRKAGKMDDSKITNGNVNHVANKIFHDILIRHPNSWICRECELLNAYNSDSCDICCKNWQDIGLWVCKMCSLINKISANQCDACGETNTEIPKPIPTDKKNMDKQTFQKQKNPKQIPKNNQGKIASETKTKAKIFKDLIANDKCNLSNDSWKCWYKPCKHINDKALVFCFACKLQKNAPEKPTDSVQCNTQDKTNTVWICLQCHKRNKKMDSQCAGRNCNTSRFSTPPEPASKIEVKELQNLPEQSNNHSEIGDRIIRDRSSEIEEKPSKPDDQVWACTKCTFNNTLSKAKCELCKTDRDETSNKWQCWHKNCKQMNDEEYNFCQSCNLYRHYCPDRGDIVKMHVKGKAAKHIWICVTCSKFNDLDKVKCSGKGCKEDRFDKTLKNF